MNSVTRNGANHIFEDDLTLFALQFLSPDQSAEIFAHLQRCDICRRQLAEIQGDLATLALTSELQEPPVGAREQFLNRVAKEKKLLPIDRIEPEISQEPVLAARKSSIYGSGQEESESRGRGAVVMARLGWALAAAVSVFAFLQFQQRQVLQSLLAAENTTLSLSAQQAADAREQATRAQKALDTLTGAGAMQVSLHLPDVTAPQPEAQAAYMARTGALVLVASHLNPLASGKTYELWLLPAQPHGSPIPAGTFKPDAKGYASVVLPSLPKGIAAKGFGVTIEPEGGSVAPTPPIVLAGM